MKIVKVVDYDGKTDEPFETLIAEKVSHVWLQPENESKPYVVEILSYDSTPKDEIDPHEDFDAVILTFQINSETCIKYQFRFDQEFLHDIVIY